MEQTGEDHFTLNVMYGVKKLKPIEHIATWKSHELFDMESEIMRMTDCDDMMLVMALNAGMHISFTNERPPSPPRQNWLQRLFAS